MVGVFAAKQTKIQAQQLIAFPFVSTHNHFSLDRGGKVFKRTAPVIKLPKGARRMITFGCWAC